MKNDSKKDTDVKSKKTAKAVQNEKNVADNTNSSNIPAKSNKVFEKDDLLRFKLLETKYQNAQMFVQLKTHEFEKAKAAWETHGKELISEIEQGRINFQNIANELSKIRAEIEQKYSINLDRVSYHESTGVIYEH